MQVPATFKRPDSWDDNTLDGGRYTLASEMHLIGCILLACEDLSPSGRKFGSLLKHKKITLAQALAHPYLEGVG